MSELIVPSVPGNFRSRRGAIAMPGDIYNICQRIGEMFPTLTITFKHDGREKPYIIYENCIDGVIRFVAEYEKLHAGVIDDLNFMKQPFKQRVEEEERRIKAKNDQLGKPDPEFQEKWMSEFRHDLIKAGFVHGATPGGRTRNIHRKGGGVNG